ncbi:MAG TPA: hypothetical protein VHY79_12610 [Rhizomicrobium sp.]|nr:hypothetical protein [Rhizomicrobium sp.]
MNKKPVNKVALVLWILAALFVASELWTFIDLLQTASSLHGGETYLVGQGITQSVRLTFMEAANLTAAGMLIELVDQIRWTIVRAAEKS